MYEMRAFVTFIRTEVRGHGLVNELDSASTPTGQNPLAAIAPVYKHRSLNIYIYIFGSKCEKSDLSRVESTCSLAAKFSVTNSGLWPNSTVLGESLVASDLG